jgi:hypothetical protein
MPPVGFEPIILVSERPQTHALDRTATGIGNIIYAETYYATETAAFLDRTALIS